MEHSVYVKLTDDLADWLHKHRIDNPSFIRAILFHMKGMAPDEQERTINFYRDMRDPIPINLYVEDRHLPLYVKEGDTVPQHA